MVFFNHATRQMTAKIVYYGPGLCGKTTNLSAIYERTSQKARGEMVSLNTETDRTLFFDLLPMDVGIIGGFKAKLQLYTVPGQVFYNSTRKLVLKGVDGIVFVADSQTAMLDANRESIQNLTENLRELGLDIGEIPMVFQWNKRDLKQLVAIDVLERELNPRRMVSFPACARTGEGVFETLRGISRLALAQIKQLHLGDGTPSRPPEPPAPPPEPLAQLPEAQPPLPAWSRATDPAPLEPTTAKTIIAALDTHPGAGTHPGPGAHPGVDTHPGGTLPEALSFLDLTPAAKSPSGGTLPEALSFLDLSSNLDLFENTADDPVPELPAPQPEAVLPPEAQVKVMAPLVVKLLPPQPAKSAGPTHPGAPFFASGMPRVTLRPPSALLAPKPSPLRGHPGVRPPVLQVALPADVDGELEVHVQVRRKGLLVAESATAISAGADGCSLSIEFKRS
jgi:signal recognition particle receptor subunit beta